MGICSSDRNKAPIKNRMVDSEYKEVSNYLELEDYRRKSSVETQANSPKSPINDKEENTLSNTLEHPKSNHQLELPCISLFLDFPKQKSQDSGLEFVSGKISPRKIRYAKAAVSKYEEEAALQDGTLRIIFDCIDTDQDGIVGPEDVTKCLSFVLALEKPQDQDIKAMATVFQKFGEGNKDKWNFNVFKEFMNAQQEQSYYEY